MTRRELSTSQEFTLSNGRTVCITSLTLEVSDHTWIMDYDCVQELDGAERQELEAALDVRIDELISEAAK